MTVILLLGLCPLIQACVMPRPEAPPIHTYQLTLEAWSGEQSAVRSGTGPVLLVAQPQADPGFDTPRMAFLRRRYELEYYALSQWADTPARMLMPLLVEALNRETRWRAVVAMPASIKADYRLETYSLVLQQEFHRQPSRARVAARMQLVDLNNQRIVGTRTFEAVEDAATDDAYGGVVAANHAVARWLEQIRAWTVACTTNGRDCGPS
ncbi:MAG TPA: ABC-type transport auxiliary lipoprotein family protein [Nitrospira sp.]|nr:ABC-type transport auxiliary lipoprotein family protein [Nitrospira sp.]